MDPDQKHHPIFGICLVDFHHKRGPEVEYWHGLPPGTQEEGLWRDLPFQALPDGSHSFEETFAYFTLLFNERTMSSLPNDNVDLPEDQLADYTTYFAISCSRQIRSDDLLTRDQDVTRSTVQKAIVVVSRLPIFGQIKDKLSIVTNVFFMQHDFTDKTILDTLYDNLVAIYDQDSTANQLPVTSNNKNFQTADNGALYVGLYLRKIIYTFKRDTLVLLKAMLLERKIIFYGTNVEDLCNLQFGLISLIPALISHLQDSVSPQLFKDWTHESVVNSFKSADKNSVYRFLGLPLRIFEKGGLFSPYTPLQQINDIKSERTKFFTIGTSNSLLYEQRDQLCDIFVNLDNKSVEIIDKTINASLNLSHHDKKWIESIVSVVNESWNDQDHETPSNSRYEGSDDFIREQFEDYLIGLLSSSKLHDYIDAHRGNEVALGTLDEELIKNEPISLFNDNWVQEWRKTQNYRNFNLTTDDRIFDLFPPRHVYSGVDPFTLFQQRFVSTFQNLKKNSNNNNNNNNNNNSTANSSATAGDEEKAQLNNTINSNKSSDSLNKKQQSNGTPTFSKSEKDIAAVWNNWKGYFNKKKHKTSESKEELSDEKGESSTNVSSKISITNSDHRSEDGLKRTTSAKSTLETALEGLGIHFDHKGNSDKDKTTQRGKQATPQINVTNDKDTTVLLNSNDATLRPRNSADGEQSDSDDSFIDVLDQYD